jgi:amino acid adenylation domain-containing protein
LSFLEASLNQILNQKKELAAVECSDQIYTYQDLQEKSLAIADEIKRRSISKQGVAILSSRSFSSYAAVLGTLISENFYVPISKKNPDLRNVNLIQKLNIKILLFETCDKSSVQELQKLLPEVQFVNLDGILSKLSKAFDIRLFHTSYAMCTSGSTGEPQIVFVRQTQLSAFIKNLFELVSVSPSSRVSQTYDLVFDPSLADVFMAFYYGACLIPLVENQQFDVFNYIKDKNISHWSSVPSLIWLNLKRSPMIPFKGLVHSIFTGENLTTELMQKWQNNFEKTKMINFYGPVETTIWVSSSSIKSSQTKEVFCSIGEPFPNHSFQILDEKFEPTAVGVVGTLMIAGPQVSCEYIDNTEATRKHFLQFSWDHEQKIWFNTGDLAIKDEKSQFRILGRVDHQFKISGQRMSVEEIEKVYSKISNGRLCFAIVLNDQVFLALLEKPKNLSSFQIYQEMKKHLPTIFLPKAMYQIFDDQTTLSGKLNRKAVTELLKKRESLIEYK